jgi:Cobalamin adenosyltransferase
VAAAKDANPEILRYLNRLSDLCWVLARYAKKIVLRENDPDYSCNRALKISNAAAASSVLFRYASSNETIAHYLLPHVCSRQFVFC